VHTVLTLWLFARAALPGERFDVAPGVPSEPAPGVTAPALPPIESPPLEPAPVESPPVVPSGPAVPDGPIVPSDPQPPSMPPVPGNPEPGDPTAPDREPGPGGTLALALEWNAPATCPQGDRVQVVVATLLARKVELEPASHLRVRGDIAPLGSRWLLQLAIDDHGTVEQRRLEGDRCDTLADAAALIIATGIDPRQVAASLAEPSEPPRRGARADRPRTSDPSPGGRRKLRVALGVASGPALGFTPEVAAWLQGDVALLIGRARVAAQVGHAFARNTGDGVGATVRNTSGTLRGCFAPTQRKISLPVCGLFELGATSAIGRGPVISQRKQALWIATGLGAGIEYAVVPRFALVAQVDALVALYRPRFHVQTPDGSRQVFQAAPAGVRLVLGVSVRLP
jgi:hypothetical protein